jgi:hypothetical protein
MGDILAEIKNKLRSKGLIEHELFTWGRRKITSFTDYQFAFLGMKGRAITILPVVTFKNILFDEVQHFTKKSIQGINFSGLTSTLQISFNCGNSAKYSILQGKSDIQRIISTFYAYYYPVLR